MPEKADPLSALREALRGLEEALNCINRLSPRTITDDWRAELDVARAALSGEAPDRDGEIERIATNVAEAIENVLRPALVVAIEAVGPRSDYHYTVGYVNAILAAIPDAVYAAPSLEGARHPEAGETPHPQWWRDRGEDPPVSPEEAKARLAAIRSAAPVEPT